ncbi:alpha/beta fold hydrolase [Rhodococcus opacus]|uniref:AB hydrolase-1 domain-containing protein n=1 Tax=Rhodococcus opacus TaxID=37919 RepID=A0A076EY85_RHOOP|nr:alpha/beta hydrolase [Rhodococcus opacus]AII10905.1 hypothetical protein EP51_42955 [Rhodococcus opacus]
MRTLADGLCEAGYVVDIVDMRGHGRSDWASDYSMMRLATDVVRLAGASALIRAVVGSSNGGNAALAASPHPRFREQVGALVLIDVTPTPGPEAEEIVAFVMENVEGFDSVERAASRLARHRSDGTLPDPQRLAPRMIQLGGRWHLPWDPAVVTSDTGPARGRHRDLLEDAARSRQGPLLLVRGELSRMVEDAAVERLSSLAPQLESATVAGVGHLVSRTNGALWPAPILRFLQQHVGDTEQLL